MLENSFAFFIWMKMNTFIYTFPSFFVSLKTFFFFLQILQEAFCVYSSQTFNVFAFSKVLNFYLWYVTGILFSSLDFIFYSYDVCICYAYIVLSMYRHLLVSSLYWFYSLIIIRKTFSSLYYKEIYPFYSSSYLVTFFTFQFLMHSKFITMCDVSNELSMHYSIWAYNFLSSDLRSCIYYRLSFPVDEDSFLDFLPCSSIKSGQFMCQYHVI